jgi:hypothetical protein
MTSTQIRLAGWALITGGVLSIAGFLAASTIVGSSGDANDARFSDPLWAPLNSVALAGAVITLLGLPAILAAHGERAQRLTLVGYVGIFVPLVMLNVGESTTETFIKPYLVHHGGVPKNLPTGFETFMGVALLILIVGVVCLGIAVIRARVFPSWVGALLIACIPLSVAGGSLPGPLALLGDYLAFIALIAIGRQVVSVESRRAISRASGLSLESSTAALGR